MTDKNTPDLSRRTVLQTLGAAGFTVTVPVTSAESDETTESKLRVGQYSNLSSAAQEVFRTALQKGKLTQQATTLPRELLLYSHLSYKDSIYAINHLLEYQPTYRIQPKKTSKEQIRNRIQQQVGNERRTPEELIERKGQVQHSQLPAKTHQLVTTALERGSVTTSKEPAEELLRHRYLRSENTLYESRTSIRERAIITLAPTPLK